MQTCRIASDSVTDTDRFRRFPVMPVSQQLGNHIGRLLLIGRLLRTPNCALAPDPSVRFVHWSSLLTEDSKTSSGVTMGDPPADTIQGVTP